MKLTPVVAAFLGILAIALRAQDPITGTVSGRVVDPAGGRPVEFATIAVKDNSGGKPVRTEATDARGAFELEGIPAGEYRLVYGLVGGAREAMVAFAIDAQHRTVDLGRLALGGDAAG